MGYHHIDPSKAERECSTCRPSGKPNPHIYGSSGSVVSDCPDCDGTGKLTAEPEIHVWQDLPTGEWYYGKGDGVYPTEEAALCAARTAAYSGRDYWLPAQLNRARRTVKVCVIEAAVVDGVLYVSPAPTAALERDRTFLPAWVSADQLCTAYYEAHAISVSEEIEIAPEAAS